MKASEAFKQDWFRGECETLTTVDNTGSEDETLRKEVSSTPENSSHERVSSERECSETGGRTFGEYITPTFNKNEPSKPKNESKTRKHTRYIPLSGKIDYIEFKRNEDSVRRENSQRNGNEYIVAFHDLDPRSVHADKGLRAPYSRGLLKEGFFSRKADDYLTLDSSFVKCNDEINANKLEHTYSTIAEEAKIPDAASFSEPTSAQVRNGHLHQNKCRPRKLTLLVVLNVVLILTNFVGLPMIFVFQNRWNNVKEPNENHSVCVSCSAMQQNSNKIYDDETNETKILRLVDQRQQRFRDVESNFSQTDKELCDTVPMYVYCTQHKAAMHLVGTFDLKVRQIVWRNEADSSNLTLTEDLTKVIVGVSGNYFVYVTVLFDVPSTSDKASRCAFKIFQHHPQGMIGEFDRGICQTEDTPTEGTKVRCNAHRVGRLNRGDKLSIHVGSVVHDVISLEKDIHEFGLFEM